MQITTYKVHKVEHAMGSAHSSLDERASRAMSGLSVSMGRNAAACLTDAECPLTPTKAADGLADTSPKSCTFDVSPKAASAFSEAAGPARLDSAGDSELTLDFTEAGCVLRESSSFSHQVGFCLTAFSPCVAVQSIMSGRSKPCQ